MRRRLSILLVMVMLAFSLAACGGKDNAGKDSTGAGNTEKGNTESNDTGKGNTANTGSAAKINITINPDADILIGEDGKVVEIVCNNADATTAYGKLDVKGQDIETVAKEMVKAATEAGFMQDEKPVTLTVEASQNTGQQLLDQAVEAKDGVQKALTEEDFQHAPVIAEIKEGEVTDDTCDLCYGNGVIVCDGCNGTTFLDGNAWTICGKCTGEGKAVCSLCNGKSLIDCDSCGGTGVDNNQDDGKCFACHGEGKIHCVRCGDGAGYQQCEDCNGEGRLGGLPCPRCGGTLWAMCYRCNGSGKR